jgi:hypothetical protein
MQIDKPQLTFSDQIQVEVHLLSFNIWLMLSFHLLTVTIRLTLLHSLCPKVVTLRVATVHAFRCYVIFINFQFPVFVFILAEF